MIEKQFFITNKCQCNCSYCQVEKGNWVISVNELITNIREIENKYPEEEILIHLFGGEPLMVMEEVLKPLFIKKYSPKTKFFIATNGILLNKENYNFLKNNNVEILLSIDGPKEIHNLNRSNFDLIYNQLLEVLGEDKIYGVQTTLQSNTLDSLLEIFNFFKDFPAYNICINLNKLDNNYNFEKQKENLIDNLKKISKSFVINDKKEYSYFDNNKVFMLFRDFTEINTKDVNIFSSENKKINHRILLLSGLAEDLNGDGFINKNCNNCFLKEQCQPKESKKLIEINDAMCLNLILNFYKPPISIPSSNTLFIPKRKEETMEETENYIDILLKISELNKLAIKKLQSFPSLNNQKHYIHFGTKYIYKKDGFIYKVESPYNIKLRQAVYKKAKKENIDLFLYEEIIELNDLFGVIKQEELIPLSIKDSVKELIQKNYQNYQEIYKFINKYEITLLGNEDFGLDNNGKIKCFDYAINAIISETGELIK